MKLTQQKLATKMDTDFRNLQRILSGERALQLATLVRLAENLDVDLSELFIGVNKK